MKLLFHAGHLEIFSISSGISFLELKITQTSSKKTLLDNNQCLNVLPRVYLYYRYWQKLLLEDSCTNYGFAIQIIF